MQSHTLAGRSVLIVEDEPLIALDIKTAFEAAGAHVRSAASLTVAKSLVERDGLSAAVIDLGLGDGDADALCARLSERHIPFVVHSGYAQVGEAYHSAIVIPKPANPTTLIDALAKALRA
jgi:DNA-binding NtrC family response regulator